jgi:phosphoribosylformimino-5-aminoimidazole carboxamide ribotide isomerase
MKLIPAIDIKDGACVRLYQGDFDDVTVYGDDPIAVARQFGQLKPALLHIVDLDGAAAGRPVNGDLIRQIADTVGCPIQTGGGLRDEACIETVLNHGASRAVLGSMAVTRPDLTANLLSRFGAQSIVLALDVRSRDGQFRVCTHGWTQESAFTLPEILRAYLPRGLRHVLITDIERDGALSGPNVDLYRSLVSDFPSLLIQASGGVRDAADLHALAGCGVAAAISGKALLDNRIDNKEMSPYLQNA